jgi:CheY-like chemotaxis protein
MVSVMPDGLVLSMTNVAPLAGVSILVVEDEPVIAMGIELAFADTGAKLCFATTLEDGIDLAQQQSLTVGIVDYRLASEKSTELYAYLREKGVPFLIYTGYAVPERDRHGGALIAKPATDEELREALRELLAASEK